MYVLSICLFAYCIVCFVVQFKCHIIFLVNKKSEAVKKMATDFMSCELPGRLEDLLHISETPG